MDLYKIKLTDKAQKDIIEIAKYISEELFDKAAANDHVDEIYRVIVDLSNMPKRHKLIIDEDFIIPCGMRRVGVKNYNIFYTCEDERLIVYIWRILYNKWIWQNLL
ncbi:type II toxin-antitoxin system RelE/ParE family toxin [Helicovermis profundi]|uniref:Type II toxin-antitoxin system RelE/ParE family toxin n=1 Tax=Helicovermis profundi TaxID=3065157 RepID=A0AAU9E841_9FIRM|nr:hypothetical protein HLPR_26460 [Clostridia bacterium S502]